MRQYFLDRAFVSVGYLDLLIALLYLVAATVIVMRLLAVTVLPTAVVGAIVLKLAGWVRLFASSVKPV